MIDKLPVSRFDIQSCYFCSSGGRFERGHSGFLCRIANLDFEQRLQASSGLSPKFSIIPSIFHISVRLSPQLSRSISQYNAQGLILRLSVGTIKLNIKFVTESSIASSRVPESHSRSLSEKGYNEITVTTISKYFSEGCTSSPHLLKIIQSPAAWVRLTNSGDTCRSHSYWPTRRASKSVHGGIWT